MNDNKIKIYLANELFSEAGLMYNEMLYNKLTEIGYEVYAPQKNLSINDKTKVAASKEIYDGDTTELEKCDILLAILDGPVIDPGVAAEIGWVAGFNFNNKYNPKKIIGICTDSRDGSKTASDDKNKMLTSVAESQYNYLNLYVVGAVKKYGKVFNSTDAAINWFKYKIESDKI